MSDADRRKENNIEYVSFYLDNQLLGLSVLEVQEVLPMQTITPIPKSTKALAGLLNLRGQIVTAVDLRERLGLDAAPSIQESMCIIVADGEELFSLLVDSVGDVIPVAKNKFESPPATLAPHWRHTCKGVYQLQKGLLVVMDVKALLDINNNIKNNG
ncbi:chemotaxis protein CheW [bacterium]|nr:chemotaxis protein CheW [bacterium]